jgi:hypothetical protein
MVLFCHSNDFGALWICSPFTIRILALLFAFQVVNVVQENFTVGSGL